MSEIKPENFFSFISTLAHSGALRSPLTSLAARKKSRFAEKKSASPKKKLRLCLAGLPCMAMPVQVRALRGGRKILKALKIYVFLRDF